MCMARITLDVPDDVAASLKELEARLKKLDRDVFIAGLLDAVPAP